MGVFKELDPAIALKLIEGFQDELSPEAKKLDTFYRQFKCPRGCGDLQKEFDIRHTFSDENFLTPRALLRCSNCRYLIDPHSALVLDSGNPAKIPVEVLPIIGGKYIDDDH
jgi:hypothetical protein